jgi:hypothetical protein
MSGRVSFEALLEAFEFASFGQPGEHEAYLCKETGTIHCHSEYGDNEESLPDDVDDSDKYIALPHKNELDLGKRLALKFAGEAMSDDQGQIHEIFSRPGAYARFKDLLEHRGLIQQWYEYEARAQKEALRAWCKENDVEVDG